MNTIEQVKIGQPNQDRVKKIIDSYELIALFASGIKSCLDEIFGKAENDNLEIFFEFIKSKEPQKMLIKKYVEVKKIDVPGLDTETLVHLNLIKVPKEVLTELFEEKSKFDTYMIQLENLQYSKVTLSEMFDSDSNIFMTSDDFESKVNIDLSVFAESDLEKLVVEKLQNLCNAINDLVELDILPADHRATKIEFFLTPTLTIDRKNLINKRPVILSQQLFRATRLKRFATDSKFRSTANFDLSRFLS